MKSIWQRKNKERKKELKGKKKQKTKKITFLSQANFSPWV